MEAARAAFYQRRDGKVRAACFVFLARGRYGCARGRSANRTAWKDSMKLTGAEILCETLEHLGVKEIFGYPGGAILPVYDALCKSQLHYVLVRHEQGATNM